MKSLFPNIMVLPVKSFAGAMLALGLFWLPGVGQSAHAANTTTPGVVSIQPEHKKLIVTAPYAEDQDSSNSLLVEWSDDGWITTNSSNPPGIAHSISPYVYEITGLTNGTSYDVRITYQDAITPGSEALQIQTFNLKPYNPRVHSSLSTNSSKHGGAWGIPGGKYGEFTCQTCHGKGTGNIKRVKNEIPDTIGEPVAKPVSFQATSGANSFGNDADGHTASTRICEVCHTITSVHKYNTVGLVDTNHQNANDTDCMKCHKHSRGFDASCTSCHGNDATGEFWPSVASFDSADYPTRLGRHDTHTQKLANYLSSVDATGTGDQNDDTYTTLSYKNATCNFCHPNPGGSNVDGEPHNTDTATSLASTADLHNDGPNLSFFQYLDGSPDADGVYDPAIGRCSNINCHSNGDFTWNWYDDFVAPGAINDLATSTPFGPGTLGTVDLTWTAPANDGATGPTAYNYEVRYSSSPIDSGAVWNSATIAGGPPSVLRDGSTQQMRVYGLTPGDTYYFAVKTADEKGNLSDLSNTPSGMAALDQTPPEFGGLVAAFSADVSQAVDLSWYPARDDSDERVTYNIYWISGLGSIDYSTPNATTTDVNLRVSGLTNGVPYQFAVRAVDATGNEDANLVVKEATPTAGGEQDLVAATYYAVDGACGSTSAFPYTGLLDTDTSLYCTGSWRARNELRGFDTIGQTATWILAGVDAYSVATIVEGTSFDIYVRERDGRNHTLRVYLGYSTDGSNFTPLGSVDKTVTADMRRNLRINISSISGVVPAGGLLALRLEKIDQDGREIQFRFGSGRYPSPLWVREAPLNTPPYNQTFNPMPSGSGQVTINWTSATDDQGDAIHYDLFARIDDGAVVAVDRNDDFNDASLDPKWLKRDIGPDATPVADESGGTLALEGGGADIWGSVDEFTYLYQDGVIDTDGDFQVTVKLNSLDNTDPWAKAGLMVRQNLSAGSKHASVFVTPSNGVSFQRRRLTDNVSSGTTVGAVAAPEWLRLVKTGDQFEAFYSEDGSAWTSIGTDTVVMSAPLQIGLAVTSHQGGTLATAVFDDFTTDIVETLQPDYPFIIGTNLTLADSPLTWDTAAAGIGLSAAEDVEVKLAAGDLYGHTEVLSSVWTVDNRFDSIAPAQIDDLIAEPRPKTDTVYLYWRAVGDDDMSGRASYYDIRWSSADITSDTDFANATEVTGEPVPVDPGQTQGYEVLYLPTGTVYFAIKACDEGEDGIPRNADDNCSPLSNVPNAEGGPRCGVCHNTPPDDPETIGTHLGHGYTQVDCGKCHGSSALSFQPQHSDGVIRLGWKTGDMEADGKGAPVIKTDTNITYHQPDTAVVIYADDGVANDFGAGNEGGGGGFDDVPGGAGDHIDNGTCSGFNGSGVTGCHGSGTPTWGKPDTVNCATCHGTPGRKLDFYGRLFDDPTKAGKFGDPDIPIVQATPALDLMGQTTGSKVGQHLKHVNYSYRLTGQACYLCHKDHEHASGTVDIKLDVSAGTGATFTAGAPSSCSGTSGLTCHGDNTTPPQWDSGFEVACNECHGFAGKTFNVGGITRADSQIDHVWDRGIGGSEPFQVRDCNYCHTEGHPRGAVGFRIQAISQTSGATVTSAAHGLSVGEEIVLYADGMTELFGQSAKVLTVVDADNFTIGDIATSAPIDTSGYGAFINGSWLRLKPETGTITAITRSAVATVTSTGHGLQTGDNVYLTVAGMTELDKWVGLVTVLDANTFRLQYVDSSAFNAFTSGSWRKAQGIAILIPNNPRVGINYTTGGIHLKRTIGGRGPYDSEAEMCWGCHDDNGISEWGQNNHIANQQPGESGSQTITAITRATTPVVTSAGHGLKTGDRIFLKVSGMTQLDNWSGAVSVIDANNFSLDGIDTTGFNAFTSGSWGTYDYGVLHDGSGSWGSRTNKVSNWIDAQWDSANFRYKTAAIQSTHSVNRVDGQAGVETDASVIRCSYCHDVHNMNKATNDAWTGKPFLRGTWMGNLYREDGAPRWDSGGDQHSYRGNQMFGAVPRGNRGPDSTFGLYEAEMGGYWIDQNSGNPTAGKSIDDMAGLCEMCHGNNDGRWDSGEIDVIDQFPSENNWMSAAGNGHSNAVLGASGVSGGLATNIMTNAWRGINYTPGDNWNIPAMGYEGVTSQQLYGTRNNDQKSYTGDDRGTGVAPFATNTNNSNDVEFTALSVENNNNYGGYEWGVVQDNATTEDKFHEFACSKCHNPHASRLPRLMITNCLDVRNNTWDDQWEGDADWQNGDNGPYTNNLQSNVYDPAVDPATTSMGTISRDYGDPDGDNDNDQMAYLKSAQNCHRATGSSASGQLSGWNKVTPPASPAGPY